MTEPKNTATDAPRTHYSFRAEFGTKDRSLLKSSVVDEFEEMVKGFARMYDLRSWSVSRPLTNEEVVEFDDLADEDEEELCDAEGAVKLTTYGIMN